MSTYFVCFVCLLYSLCRVQMYFIVSRFCGFAPRHSPGFCPWTPLASSAPVLVAVMLTSPRVLRPRLTPQIPRSKLRPSARPHSFGVFVCVNCGMAPRSCPSFYTLTVFAPRILHLSCIGTLRFEQLRTFHRLSHKYKDLTHKDKDKK